MKAKKIQSELKKLSVDLKEIAEDIGTQNFADETGLNSKDVSAWLNGHRDFSYEKLLRIALKISKRLLSHRKSK